jgi:CSLREA domain-containing protein
MHSNIYQTKLFTHKSIGQLLLIPAAFLLTLTFVLLRPSPALADGGISVTTTDDEYSDAGPGNGCSLREAIQSANDDKDFGGCTRSGTAPYTITVPAAIYTLTITSTDENDNVDGDLDLRASMTIEGAGAGQTIIQAGPDPSSGIDRIFDVFVDGLTINLSHLTVRHGNADSGGGIEHRGDGTLTVTDCAITDNKASEAQGGGIFVTDGAVTINNSTVSNNTSYSSGGGLATPGTTNNPTLYVNNSTISGNTAESNGGGGIRLQGGTLEIASTTIVSNTALGGYPGRGGGGIRTTTATNPSIKNSIIANNSADGVPGPDCQGTINSGGYNLVGDTTDCGGTVGTDITGQDPLLGPLANNGGDTETHALLARSPAIDAANPSGCTDVDGASLITDQRGQSRAYDGNGDSTVACDIGAVETQPDIMVLDNGVIISDDTGRADFGLTREGSPITKTFTISNTGGYTLTLTEPITVPAGFSVANSFADTNVAPGDAITFTIRLDATSVGIYSGTLAFANNDADENPYAFTVIGQIEPVSYLPIIFKNH